jgi:hypothetical protein
MSFLSNIWNSVVGFFSTEEKETIETYTSIIKPRSTKNFQITNERNFHVRNEKFSIVNSSRPRICPRCNSTGTIIKDRNKWKCDAAKSGCEYRW